MSSVDDVPTEQEGIAATGRAAAALGRHAGLVDALRVPSHRCLDPSQPRALHSFTYCPQSALDYLFPSVVLSGRSSPGVALRLFLDSG